jgi:hypothetical protein
MAEYTFPSEDGCVYDLFIEYAAQDARPIKISLNDIVISINACGTTTGGWYEKDQKWQSLPRVYAKEGQNHLTLSSGSPFPHIRAIKLVPRPSH